MFAVWMPKLLGVARPLGPTLSLDFTTAALDSRIAASGGANGTRTNSVGAIVAATAPRFDYDPSTLAIKGLLIEQAATNLLLNSTIDGANLATQSVALTAQSYILSFYGTGTVTLSGASTAGPLVGSGAYPTRSTLTFTPSAGSVTFTVTGTVQYAQLEVTPTSAGATSFIPTAGAAVTRTQDVLTMPTTGWYSGSVHTLAVDFMAANSGGQLFACSLGTGHPSIRRVAGNIVQAELDSSSGVLNPVGTSYVSNAVTKVAVAFKALDSAGSLNGGAVSTAAPVASSSGASTLYLGSNGGGTGAHHGHLRRLRYYPRRVSNGNLVAITT